jgi:hypothetical protein
MGEFLAVAVGKLFESSPFPRPETNPHNAPVVQVLFFVN